VPADGIVEYRTTLVGFDARPYWFRVRAENEAGSGIMSAISNRVTEACHAGQFLQTQRNKTEDIVCADCPPGAYCAGLPHRNVTALQGFWRVPWAESGLVFQECPEKASCFGVLLDEQGDAYIRELIAAATSNATASNSTAATNSTAISSRLRMLQSTTTSEQDLLARLDMTASDFTPVAVPNLVLDAPKIESCGEGLQGQLCTSCANGYTRSGNFSCRKCASRSFIIAVMVLVVILMLAIVGFVIHRTLKTKEREGRIEVMIMKIGVSHLQTVALAATFDLQWPVVVLNLFESMDTASSVSPNVVSVDCLVDRNSEVGARTFYLKSAMILLAPLLFIAAICAFWIGRWQMTMWSTESNREKLIQDAEAMLNKSQRDQHASHSQLPVHASSGGSSLGNEDDGGLAATSSDASSSAGSSIGRKPSRSEMMVKFINRESSRKSVLNMPGLSKLRAELNSLPVAAADGGSSSGAISPRHGMPSKPTSPKPKKPKAPPRPMAKKGNTKSPVSSINPLDDAAVEVEELRQAGFSMVEIANFQARARNIDKKSSTWSHTTDRIMVSCIVIGFLIHATVSKAALRLFTCIDIGGTVEDAAQTSSDASPIDVASERSVLMYDMDVPCDGQLSFVAKYFIGMPFFAIYSLGIPLAAGLFMWYNRKQLEDPAFGRKFYFLFAGFQTEAAYWESVIAIRKVGLAVISVFLRPEGIDVQTYCALLLVFVAGVVHARIWPY